MAGRTGQGGTEGYRRPLDTQDRDGTPLPIIAIPVFGYKSHISIDRRYGFIRAAAVTSASHPDGRMLRHVINRENTGSEVWADSAYRSQSNEAWLADRMLTSQIHRRKPKGKSMPIATARANAAKSSIRARIEHVFAHQKNRFGLFIRTIGITRAEAKMTLANLAYNFDRSFSMKSAPSRHESARNTGKCPCRAPQTVKCGS
ncbi:MAG: transposase [Devosia sp.]